MLDLKFVRENPEIVKQNIKNKFQDQKLPLVDEVIQLDAERRASQQEADQLRAERNKLSKQIGALMGQGKKEEAEDNWDLYPLRPTMPLRTPWGCILFEKVLTDDIPFTKESFAEEYVSLPELAEKREPSLWHHPHFSGKKHRSGRRRLQSQGTEFPRSRGRRNRGSLIKNTKPRI